MDAVLLLRVTSLLPCLLHPPLKLPYIALELYSPMMAQVIGAITQPLRIDGQCRPSLVDTPVVRAQELRSGYRSRPSASDCCDHVASTPQFGEVETEDPHDLLTFVLL